MRSAAILRLALVALAFAGAADARAAERLSGEAIRRAFENNTVSGRYSGSNLPFSEFHHPDGRASGHNRNVANKDACWTTTPEAVCYYYGPQETRRTYCFTVELSGSLYVLRNRPSGRINGIATVEPGDPHGFGKSAAAWTCDGLISQAPGRADLARLGWAGNRSTGFSQNCAPAGSAAMRRSIRHRCRTSRARSSRRPRRPVCASPAKRPEPASTPAGNPSPTRRAFACAAGSGSTRPRSTMRARSRSCRWGIASRV